MIDARTATIAKSVASKIVTLIRRAEGEIGNGKTTRLNYDELSVFPNQREGFPQCVARQDVEIANVSRSSDGREVKLCPARHFRKFFRSFVAGESPRFLDGRHLHNFLPLLN